jgi:23S rRNA (uracil1939-C5)-methyltransferase
MATNRNIPFKIDSMDSLGQGVSKLDNKITFLSKTLPGEEGEAELLAQKKGVQFARKLQVSKPAANRIQPVCPHFEVCPSCHYLHTDYDSELSYKKKALEQMFYKMPRPEIEVIAGVRRTEYRNRVQLHYDTRSRKFGLLDAKLNRIVSVPSCLIGLPKIQEEIRRLYQSDNWLKEAPKTVPQGHVEIYLKGENLSVVWNKNYADGGFSQVFREMNDLLIDELTKWNQSLPPSDVLDLFAGNGNLTQNLQFKNRLCVDIYSSTPKADFVSQELYDPKALNLILKELKKRDMRANQVILDPPRSGMKDLNTWLEALKPQHVAYVSCDPHTLIRDLKTVTNYNLTRVVLLDFFPSTFHFESLVFFTRKE